jgi:16S rRNA G966 N2-methylase RsmD
MRPPAVEKLGFYPTSIRVIEALKTWFAPANDGRLLDPCAGEGSAAGLLAKALNCTSWGVELSPARAQVAEKNMDRVLCAAWQTCTLTNESITLLFLNPPYNYDRFGDQRRLETEFLKTTTPKLMRGGALIYIVPLKLLGDETVAALLVAYYEDLVVLRYPDTEYGQVIVMGYRRQHYKNPSKEEIEATQKLAKFEPPMLEAVSSPRYTLLPAVTKGAGGTGIRFSQMDYTAEELADATLKKGLMYSRTWLDLVDPSRLEAKMGQPVMPLKKGHIAMVMAAGTMGIMRLTDENGQPMLVKGRVVKVTEKVGTEETKSGDQMDILRDRYMTTISVIRQSGIEVITEVGQLSEFMQKYGEQIGRFITDRTRPLYNFDPTPAEAAILDMLSRHRKPLPGQQKPGLLQIQRHVATAAARVLRLKRRGNIQGEMGSGKTTMALASLALLDAYPAIIMCDPHMVEKWTREAKEVIPGVQVMELRRIGGQKHQQTNDVKRFLESYEKGLLGKKAIAVVAHTTAKLGTGWRHTYIKRRIGGVVTLCCSTCGNPITIYDHGMEVPATAEEDMGQKRLFCRARVSGYALDEEGRVKRDEDGKPVWEKRECHAPLFANDVGDKRYPIADYIFRHAKFCFNMLIADEVHKFKGKSSDRGIAYHQLVQSVRYTINLTGTFFGGPSTSIFWLLQRNDPKVSRDFDFHDERRWAARYGVLEFRRLSKKGYNDDETEVGFTGNRRYQNIAKELPGISPSIINRLLHNTVFLSLKDLGLVLPEYTEQVAALNMLPENPLGESHSDQYGRMESSLRAKARQDKRFLSVWLQWSLARPNSAFRDEKVQTEIMDDKDDGGDDVELMDVVETEIVNGKAKLKRTLMELPAVIDDGKALLPKEAWLVDFVSAEREQGRKTLIYLRQTGTRDIQYRLEKILKDAGARALVLTSGVEARKREAWIAGKVFGIDALIVNPRLVETGLDLIAFSNVVFFEIEFSLYTLWQALRRVWRPGQTQKVKAVFAIYNNTMEARALSLMGRKMKAGQTLYGDEVSGAIVPEDEGDLLLKLAREALNKADIPDLQSLFAENCRVERPTPPSVTGPTSTVIDIPGAKTEPVLSPAPAKTVTFDNWMDARGADSLNSGRKKKVSAGQMSLFDLLD